MSFGNPGSTIGHEMAHAFDNYHHDLDEKGKWKPWNDTESEEEYQNRAQCFASQYSSYNVTDTNLKIDGNLTLGENISDSGGLKAAYYAYLDYEKQFGIEPRLPALEYTPHQLFFIQEASTSCGKERKEMLEYYLKKDGHSPRRFRIIGPYSNSEEFAKTFNCPKGSPMNPNEKCQIW